MEIILESKTTINQGKKKIVLDILEDFWPEL